MTPELHARLEALVAMDDGTCSQRTAIVAALKKIVAEGTH